MLPYKNLILWLSRFQQSFHVGLQSSETDSILWLYFDWFNSYNLKGNLTVYVVEYNLEVCGQNLEMYLVPFVWNVFYPRGELLDWL